ncbi:hypothetical protein ACQ4PT_018183 [Festuca glaucescens]
MRALRSSLASIERSFSSIKRLLAPTKCPSYDGLPTELLDLIIARLPDPADRARARAVCRSWHAAVRRHGSQPWRLPSTISHRHRRRLRSLPRGAHTVGSTNDWLAVRVGKEHRKYLLHNPFFKKTVPLPELDAVVGHDRRNGRACGCHRQGAKDTTLHPYIIDFAFLEGKLYAITTAEDLIPFDLSLDGKGRPVVTMGRRLIKQPPYYHGHDVWPTSSSDDDDEEDEEEDDDYEAATADDDDDDDDDGNNDDDNNNDDEMDEQVEAAPNEEEEDDEAPYPNDIAFINCPTQFLPHSEDINITSRHLIESCGKLLMVRHHQKMCPRRRVLYLTLGVEVFEADTCAGAWMPVTHGLGGGRALFISLNFSKSIAAPCGEVEEDVIYFRDTGEVFNLKTRTSSPSRLCRSSGLETWLLHPELVF